MVPASQTGLAGRSGSSQAAPRLRGVGLHCDLTVLLPGSARLRVSFKERQQFRGGRAACRARNAGGGAPGRRLLCPCREGWERTRDWGGSVHWATWRRLSAVRRSGCRWEVRDPVPWPEPRPGAASFSPGGWAPASPLCREPRRPWPLPSPQALPPLPSRLPSPPPLLPESTPSCKAGSRVPVPSPSWVPWPAGLALCLAEAGGLTAVTSSGAGTWGSISARPHHCLSAQSPRHPERRVVPVQSGSMAEGPPPSPGADLGWGLPIALRLSPGILTASGKGLRRGVRVGSDEGRGLPGTGARPPERRPLGTGRGPANAADAAAAVGVGGVGTASLNTRPLAGVRDGFVLAEAPLVPAGVTVG